MKKRFVKKYLSLQIYLDYIATFKYRFLAVLFCFIVANILLAVVPLYIGQLVESLSQKPIPENTVFWLAGTLVFLSISHDIVWHASDWLYRGFTNTKQYEFENTIFQAVIAKPYPYFVDKFTGKISSYITALGHRFREFLEAFYYNYVSLAVRLPVITGILFTVNWYTGVIFIASLFGMFISGRFLIRLTKKAEQELTDVSSSLDGYVIDIISNFVSVKAFGRERRELREVTLRRKEVIRRSSKQLFWEIMFWSAMSLIVRWVVWSVTIILNVALFLHGQLSLAQVTTFISVLVIFSDYIWEALWSVSRFIERMAQAEEAYHYLFGDRNVIRERNMTLEHRAHLEFTHQIELSNVTFAYPDKEEAGVLKNISLKVRKNEKIGVVGVSGSGKTTLIKLLLGYYHLPEGMLKVDGEGVDNRNLIKLISYVPQDTTLFHRTIAENIAYGSARKTTQADIEQAARRAHAHEFVTQIEEGYDAMVGERGIKLSMGQRQRIAIARAFLDHKPILILDEATSALDSESEVMVQQSLEDLWHDKTVIAIAHRLSTLRHMDRIIVMDDGRIIEQGTHDGLLEQKGKYYKLWQHQSGSILAE